MSRRSTPSRYGIWCSAAVAARSAGCWNARGEMPSSRYVWSGSVIGGQGYGVSRRPAPAAAKVLDCGPMRAATIRDQESLVEDHPDPQPGAGEILVRVRAAGINGADIIQRRGMYPAPKGSPQ